MALDIRLDKVGADVEFFLLDKEGKPVPCIGIVGGTKSKPLPLISGRPGYMIQEDNVALEWGIPPAPDKWSFIYSCMRAQEEIEEKLRPLELKSAIVPSMRFTKEQLDHPQAKHLGCEEDFNVWEREVNDTPDITGENETLRTTGGHVHLSYFLEGRVPQYPKDLDALECVVMACDLFIASASIILDKDKERRKLYGKAGAFRPKPYGVEYRTLSCFWTANPRLIAWVYDQIELVFSNLRGLESPHKWLKEHKDMVTKIINNGDEPMARNLMSKYSIRLPQ